jgi:hypothetical protein
MPATIPTPDNADNADNADDLTFAPYQPSETPTGRKPTPTGTAVSTTKGSPEAGTSTPAPVAASDDADVWIIPAALLALILTGITAACVWIYRRRTRDDADPFVDGSANE